MRNILLAGTAVVLAMLAGPVMAEPVEITLCAARKDGGYDAVMRSIGTELAKRGRKVLVANLTGSEDILTSLESGECAYGPAQKDIHYLMSGRDAGFQAGVQPVARLYSEAMTMMCSPTSGIDELSDLKKGDTVIVGELGSGSALTWENMVAVEKEHGNGSSWIEATPEYGPLDEAGAALSLGTAKCAFGVGAVPISWAKELDAQGLTVAWIYDKDLDDLEHAGGPLYEQARVPVGPYSTKFDTYVIPAVLFRSAKTKVDPEVDRIVKRMAPSLGQRLNTVK